MTGFVPDLFRLIGNYNFIEELVIWSAEVNTNRAEIELRDKPAAACDATDTAKEIHTFFKSDSET